MYLRKIEIQGFKSFANKTVLDFESGITAVVGPNGSGKSNIADAVRWVLGEQRIKQLRGDHMQDVIFAGTENRRPLSYAAVAITLDNSDHALAVDYEEVTVTRRLYRSGESEYLLNGTNCRLKDVNELFYDTGIGKEGYSIIGQGQIERIINGKADERRELFDEAAGIVKYKKRKAMTQKKLDDERANLVRVTDILSELETQLTPLQKESEKAKTYLNKKEELKKYDINLFLVEMKRLQEQVDELTEKIDTVHADLLTAQNEYEATKTEYHTIEDELEQIEVEISSGQEQLNRTNLLKQQLEGRIDVLNEQIRTARLHDEHANERSQTVASELSIREQRLEELAQEARELETRLAESEKRGEEQKAREVALRSAITEMEDALEQGQADLVKEINSRANAKAELERCATLLAQNMERAETLRSEVNSSGTDTESLEQDIRELKQNLSVVEEKMNEKRSRRQELEQKISRLQDELSGSSRKLQESESAYNRERSRFESLKALTERYEGYGNSVRRVMEQKDREPGIIGLVADIIKTDKKYELAIETALGGSIQNVIVDTEETAKRLIAFLKENRYGRATFLPLTGTKHNRPLDRTEVFREQGVLGLAADLVKADKAYEGITAYLLGRIIVVDTIDNGIAIARKYRYRYRLVTLDGESLNPGGSIAGGAFRSSNNYLSRRRDLQEMEAKAERLEQAYRQLLSEVESKKTLRADSYHELDNLNEALHQVELEYGSERMKLDTAEKRKNELDLALSGKADELARLQTEQTELTEEQEALRSRIQESEDSETERNQAIEEQNASLAEARNALSVFLRDVSERRLTDAGLTHRAEFLQEDSRRIRAEIEKFNEELASLSDNKDKAADEIRTKENEIEELRRTINESGELYEELHKQIADGQTKKDELNHKHKKFINRREELSRQVADLDKEQFRLTSRRENAENGLNDQISYMWNEYEITPVLAEKLKDESLNNLTEIKRAIQSIRSELHALGDVNVGAIESFREMSKRHEFLTTQRTDLIDAEAKLLEIIDELDTGMRAQFREKFAEIQVKFDEVFRRLFGGGKGTLALTEEDDVLEAGITIIAQPPGKKLQNMMQLSGGEKSLTAIALLFAIQSMKPSPFCLLDEIEAALDDANVDRFADYLALLTKHTQFIMITHRRGTMAAADRLYGITMQEKGISALVSVDLEKISDDLSQKEQKQQPAQ